MPQGQIGGDFSQGYSQTIDQEFGLNSNNPVQELGPTRGDFQPQTQSQESQFWPKTNEVHPPIPSDTRVRRALGMNPDNEVTQQDTSKFRLSLPPVAKLKQEWETHKTITIPNLYPDLQANEIRDYYFNQEDDWWDLILYPDHEFDYDKSAIENPGYYHMYRAKSGDPSIPEREAYVRNINDNGGFSYIYRRTGDLSVQLHPHLKLFQSPEFRKYISLITGYDNLEYAEGSTFISNYSAGHYNGPHTDGANGRIAFVFHLSKDWKPEMGGLFMRMDWDWKTVNKVITPPFNTLTMFDTTWQEQDGAPHLVSEVAQGINNKRISYTGWYL